MAGAGFTRRDQGRVALSHKEIAAPHAFFGKNTDGSHPYAAAFYDIAGDTRRCLYLKQIHGAGVLTLAPGDSFSDELPEADAAVTMRRDVYLSIKTADCVPVLIDAGDAVGAIHAGWRGACKGVAASCAAALEAISANPRSSWRAFIGPCIRQDNFEVKGDFIAEAQALAGDISAYLRRLPDDNGAQKHYFDLPRFVTDSLMLAGIGRIDDCGADSFPQGSGYYSHRRYMQAQKKRPSHNFSYIGAP